jgi:hypothetical protein
MKNNFFLAQLTPDYEISNFMMRKNEFAENKLKFPRLKGEKEKIS